MKLDAEHSRSIDWGGRIYPEVGDWLLAARAGSSEALGQLLQLFRQYLVVVADQELESGLQGKLGASDIVQETLFEAQRDFGAFRGQTGPELLAWLRRILLHNLLNARRRYLQTQKRAAGREVGNGDLHLLYQAAAEVTPSQHAVQREEERLLAAAMARLPEEYRRVLELRHREGCSFGDIGRQTARTADAARMLWYRAFERLARELDVKP